MDDETKRLALFASMITALILGGAAFALSLILLLWAVYLLNVVLVGVSIFTLVVSSVLISIAYVWFVEAAPE